MGNDSSHQDTPQPDWTEAQRYHHVLGAGRRATDALGIEKPRIRKTCKQVVAFFRDFEDEPLDERALRVVSSPSVPVAFGETDVKALTDAEAVFVACYLLVCDEVETRMLDGRVTWSHLQRNVEFVTEPHLRDLTLCGTLLGVKAMTCFWRMVAETKVMDRVFNDRTASLCLFELLIRSELRASAIGFFRAGLVPPPLTVDELCPPAEEGMKPITTEEQQRRIVLADTRHPVTMICRRWSGDALVVGLQVLLALGHPADKASQAFDHNHYPQDMSPLAHCISRYQVDAALLLVQHEASLKDADLYLQGMLQCVIKLTRSSRNGHLLAELCGAGLYAYASRMAEIVRTPLYGLHGPNAEAHAAQAVEQAIERGQALFEQRVVHSKRTIEDATGLPLVLAEIITAYTFLYIPPDSLDEDE